MSLFGVVLLPDDGADHRIGIGGLGKLVETTLLRVLVGTPAMKPGAMPEACAGDLVIEHFDHQFGLEGHPFFGSLGRPAAGSARRLAGKAAAAPERFKLAGQSRLVPRGDGGREAGMVELTLVIVEAEYQRADVGAAAAIAEAPYHAVGRTDALDLEHGALAAGIGLVQPLCDHAVEFGAQVIQP